MKDDAINDNSFLLFSLYIADLVQCPRSEPAKRSLKKCPSHLEGGLGLREAYPFTKDLEIKMWHNLIEQEEVILRQ